MTVDPEHELTQTADKADEAYEGAYLAPTKYLRFERIPHPGRKTMLWEVLSQSNGFKLGEIRWYSLWRQYVLWPEPQTVFNTDCLLAIADRIATLRRWRRNSKARRKGAGRERER